ncbi:MAG TPA: helix-turn-helix domain-containing protein [Clostridiales bacterium]|nr:helix-turn-helix domain-containing protein [Clostridiales bacterium]
MNNGFDIQYFDSIHPYKLYISKVTHFNLHWHNYIEIFYVKKGAIRITTGDFSFNLDEGHICFIDSGIIHSVNQTNIPNEILVLQISTESTSPFHSLQKYKFNPETYLSDLSNATLPLSELQKLLSDSYGESILKAPGYESIISSFINAIIGIMIRRYYLVFKTDDDYIAESNLQRLSHIIDYLDNHYMEKISLQQLADNLHMNYYYLSHFFKDTAGVSFQDYLNNLRVDKSLPLLADPVLNITRISYDCGFPNIKAYTKAFKEKFGVLPSEYRKAIITSGEHSPHSDPGSTLIDTYTASAGSLFSSRKSIREFFSVSEAVNLHPTTKHTLLQNIDIISSTSDEMLCGSSRELSVEPEALFCLDTSALLLIKNALKVDALSIIGDKESSLYPDNLLKQKASEIDCRITDTIFQPLISQEPDDGIEAFSLLSGNCIISSYLGDPQSNGIPPLYILKNKNIVEPFLYSSSLMTSFSVPVPALFASSFIQQLSGRVLYHCDSCIIVQQDQRYHILCFHPKSYDTYKALNKDVDFRLENYIFFAKSFPSIKFTFSFKDVKHKLRQTTLQVSNDHGCILNNWIRMGTPAYLAPELTKYLQSITQPSLNVKVPPFREAPIITVQLPPLGFSYILLEPA